MNKALFRNGTLITILLVFALCAGHRSEAAQFSLDLAGVYSSNMEREPGGESGFFSLTRFDARAFLPSVLHLHSQMGLILEDKRYQGGDSAQWGELYVGSSLYRGSIMELSCTGSGTYVRDSLVPEDDFYAAALEPQVRLHLTSTLDLALAHYVQWRKYADKMELGAAGGGEGNTTLWICITPEGKPGMKRGMNVPSAPAWSSTGCHGSTYSL